MKAPLAQLGDDCSGACSECGTGCCRASRTRVETERDNALCEGLAPIRLLGNGLQYADMEQVCAGCGEMRDEAHAWSECVARLSEAVDEYLFHDKAKPGDTMSAWMRERHDLVCERNRLSEALRDLIIEVTNREPGAKLGALDRARELLKR